MELYIHRDGQQYGPYSEDDVRSYIADGTVQESDLAWHEGASDWAPLSSLSSFSRASTVPPPPPVGTGSNNACRPVDLPAISPDMLKGYARSTLQPNETAIYHTSIHWIIFVRPGIFAFLVFLFALGSSGIWLALILTVLVMLPSIITYIGSELVITDKRILIKVGFIRRKTLEMFISKIESISINQGIIGRFLDFGTVVIRGTGGSAEPFKRIAHPLQFRNFAQLIQSHVEAR